MPSLGPEEIHGRASENGREYRPARDGRYDPNEGIRRLPEDVLREDAQILDQDREFRAGQGQVVDDDAQPEPKE